MHIRVIIEYDEEVESYSIVCHELSGCTSCGDTEKKAMDNIKTAIGDEEAHLRRGFIRSTITLKQIDTIEEWVYTFCAFSIFYRRVSCSRINTIIACLTAILV